MCLEHLSPSKAGELGSGQIAQHLVSQVRYLDFKPSRKPWQDFKVGMIMIYVLKDHSVVMVAQYDECNQCHRIVYVKITELANVLLYPFVTHTQKIALAAE